MKQILSAIHKQIIENRRVMLKNIVMFKIHTVA